MSCKPGTCSRAFKGGGGVALGGKRKGRVECIGMLGRAGPAWNGQCLVLKLNYIHCPVRKQETSLLTQRLLFRTTLIVMSRPRDVCTDQFQMVTVMNDKKESASPLFTSPHISTSYAWALGQTEANGVCSPTPRRNSHPLRDFRQRLSCPIMPGISQPGRWVFQGFERIKFPVPLAASWSEKSNC